MTSGPLRILQIYPKGDFFTGAAIQLWELARGLAGRGHRVVIATPPSETWAARCAEAGLIHAAIVMRRAWDPRAAWRLARLIRQERIQIAHAHKGRARSLTLLAGLMGARALLVLNRGVSFPIDGATRRVGYTNRHIHAIVAVCESIKRGLVSAGVPAEKISVIYSGTDVERFHPGVDGAPVRRELGLAADDVVITQIGVRSWRGWRDVLDAMPAVAQRVARARACSAISAMRGGGAPTNSSRARATRWATAGMASSTSRQPRHDRTPICVITTSSSARPSSRRTGAPSTPGWKRSTSVPE